MDESAQDLAAYRAAVDDLMLDLAPHTDRGGLRKIEMILHERCRDHDLARLLSATPCGTDAAVATLLVAVESFQPNARSSAHDLAALIRIHLLSQIDALWWGRVPAFQQDHDVLGTPDLVDLAALGTGVRYRRQATTLAGRAWRAVERRIVADRTPRTAGLRFTHVRPEAAALIDGLANDFRRLSPAGTPPLWVTSLTRSVTHQHHLRALGYAAVLPSAHCSGYAIDLEMTWYRRYDADRVLQGLLLDRQTAGDINVIDEGQAWHVCLSPSAISRLRHDFDTRIGG